MLRDAAIVWQSILLRQTVTSSAKQSEAMERHIAEAARSAVAMERVAQEIKRSADSAAESVIALRERTAQQMRAYITVITGTTGFYQERAKNIYFEGKPVLLNTGHTPAYKVSYRIKAGVMCIPVPDDFAFPLPQKGIGAGVIGPQQTGIMGGVLDDFVPDIDVDDIRYQRKNRSLYVWGIISYEDIFGVAHSTKFCHSIVWSPNGSISGFYTPGYNDAD
jgi:hypothetical protein